MEAITVAVITAVGGVLAALVQSLRKENKRDHASVTNLLHRLESKFDRHIENHAQGVYSPAPTPRKDAKRGASTVKKRTSGDSGTAAKGRRPRG